MAAALAPLPCLLALALCLVTVERDGPGEPQKEVERAVSRGLGPVVVLGNSVARNAINAEALNQGLGLRGGSVSLLSVDGTKPAHWLAIAHRNLITDAWAPTHILIYSSSSTFFFSGLDRSEDRVNLLELAGDDVDLVTELSGSGLRARLWVALDRRTLLREALLNTPKRGMVAWAHPGLGGSPHSKGAQDRGEELLSFASNRLLQQVRKGTQKLGVGMGGDGVNRDIDGMGSRTLEQLQAELEAGPMSQLAQATRQRGIRLVLALATPQRGSAFGCDPTEEVDALRTWSADHGVDLIDMRGLFLDPQDYSSSWHLGPTNARALSFSLAEQWLSSGLARLPPDAPSGQARVPCTDPLGQRPAKGLRRR